jgi:dimethylsulfoniopropionate demethylase
MVGEAQVGQITSAIWSPRLMRNIGLSLIARAQWEIGTAITVTYPDGSQQAGEISDLPFD